MTRTPKIVLSSSRDIPFDKLVLSQANVRRIKAGVSIEALAEDIARRTLLQSLNVRAVLDARGAETGMFEVPAGGRRYRALELLVRQKRLAKTALVPCVVRMSDDVSAEEDSLAENLQRAPLHPLDQFRAFKALRDQGACDEDIAARFFMSPQIVRQRLKLACVSPKLHELYADEALTLEQLMAFSVTTDHARQEEVWDSLARTQFREPYQIRRMLTEGAVRASDKRAQFVGLEAYEDAGGAVLRDLFLDDDGGWLQDPALLDRLVADKLAREADAVAAEGWKWIEAQRDFPYGHTDGLRRILGESPPLTGEETAARDALRQELETLQAEWDGGDDLPDAVDIRLGEIETALAAFENRPVRYDPADVARAGVFISVDGNGVLRLERGYVRPQDEPSVRAEGPSDAGDDDGDPDVTSSPSETGGDGTEITVGGLPQTRDDEDEGIKPIPDRVVTDLTAHRTLALRDALAGNPDTAFLAVLHALVLQKFYPAPRSSCLEIDARSTGLPNAPGLNDTPSGAAIFDRHQAWHAQMPAQPGDLWEVLQGFEHDSRQALFAHCASISVRAVYEPWARAPGKLAHADQLSRVLGLDMVKAGWVPTVENYLGRVTKARILEAVREAAGDQAAQLLEHMKKPEMAKEAQRLLADTGWLPEPLRLVDEVADPAPEALPAFLDDEDPPVDDDVPFGDPQAIAAE